MSTNLVFVGIGLAPYSIRGLTQTLEGIDGSIDTRRSINGVLVDVTPSGFDKYKSTISCEDVDSPAFDLLSFGAVVTIHCVPEFAVAGAQPSDLSTWNSGIRVPVPGSVRYQAGVIFYRPIMTMMVLAKKYSIDEYGRKVSWSIDLEEV